MRYLRWFLPIDTAFLLMTTGFFATIVGIALPNLGDSETAIVLNDPFLLRGLFPWYFPHASAFIILSVSVFALGVALRITGQPIVMLLRGVLAGIAVSVIATVLFVAGSVLAQIGGRFPIPVSVAKDALIAVQVVSYPQVSDLPVFSIAVLAFLLGFIVTLRRTTAGSFRISQLAQILFQFRVMASAIALWFVEKYKSTIGLDS